MHGSSVLTFSGSVALVRFGMSISRENSRANNVRLDKGRACCISDVAPSSSSHLSAALTAG